MKLAQHAVWMVVLAISIAALQQFSVGFVSGYATGMYVGAFKGFDVGVQEGRRFEHQMQTDAVASDEQEI